MCIIITQNSNNPCKSKGEYINILIYIPRIYSSIYKLMMKVLLLFTTSIYKHQLKRLNNKANQRIKNRTKINSSSITYLKFDSFSLQLFSII